MCHGIPRSLHDRLQPPPPPGASILVRGTLYIILYIVFCSFIVKNTHWTKGWKCLWRGHSVNQKRPLLSLSLPVLGVCIWMPLVNGTGNSPSPGRPTPGVVKQDKSSGGSVDTTKTRSGPQRVRTSSGEGPIGTAKGKQPDTEALCQPPPTPCDHEPQQFVITVQPTPHPHRLHRTCPNGAHSLVFTLCQLKTHPSWEARCRRLLANRSLDRHPFAVTGQSLSLHHQTAVGWPPLQPRFRPREFGPLRVMNCDGDVEAGAVGAKAAGLLHRPVSNGPSGSACEQSGLCPPLTSQNKSLRRRGPNSVYKGNAINCVSTPVRTIQHTYCALMPPPPRSLRLKGRRSPPHPLWRDGLNISEFVCVVPSRAHQPLLRRVDGTTPTPPATTALACAWRPFLIDASVPRRRRGPHDDVRQPAAVGAVGKGWGSVMPVMQCDPAHGNSTTFCSRLQRVFVFFELTMFSDLVRDEAQPPPPPKGCLIPQWLLACGSPVPCGRPCLSTGSPR